MPNWCKGTLKVRGTIKDLETFIVKGLNPVDFIGNDKPPLVVKNENGYFFCESDNFIHIKGTYRGFVDGLYVEYCYESKAEIGILTFDVQFAWEVNAHELLNLAKEFNVDIKIYAFESGGEFNRNVEIVGGEIIADETIEFDDYLWECICPNMGG